MVMKSGRKTLLSHPHASQNETHGDSSSRHDSSGRELDRRRFLQYMATAGAVAGWGRRAFAQGDTAASANLRLPDGTPLPLWEQPLTFSKTYYVDNQSSKADDSGPGTSARPFRTIGKAAKVLQPGERVVIASGIYRECVRPERGGTAPTQMISYEAAPGAKVFIKGSEVVKDGWTQDPATAFRRPAAGATGNPATPPPPAPPTWRYQFTGAVFPDAYNPFALASVAGDRAWLDTKAVDMGPYFRRRGLVFMDGKPLEPVELQRELVSPKLYTPPPPGEPQPLTGLPPRARGGPLMQEVGGTEDGRFWTDANGQSIHVRLPNGTPADHTIEITIREQVFAPLNRGLGYIRLKGLTFQHAGNGFPLPQRGAMVDVQGGTHWIVEDNTFEWANAIGLEIGGGGGGFGGQPSPTAHIIRGNTMRYCGVEGVAGMGTRDVLIENNLIEWCGWADAEREWESAGAKFHSAQNMLFRRNLVRHMRHANGIWLDSGNRNCRITGNVFADTVSVSAAIHMEMNRQPNQIDNNIIWDVRNAEPGTPGQRGCAGSGIFINASDQITIAQNLIGRVDNSGIFAIIRPDRAGSGTATDNNISNNIFAKCDKSAIVFLNEKNQADGNVYADMPTDFLGFFTGDTKQFVDLAAWRQEHGWDKNSAQAHMQIDFNPDTLELTMSGTSPLPKVNAVNQITDDIFGHTAGATRTPGPLADPAAKTVRKIDPRSTVSA
jgi:Right handed beta helix region